MRRLISVMALLSLAVGGCGGTNSGSGAVLPSNVTHTVTPQSTISPSSGGGSRPPTPTVSPFVVVEPDGSLALNQDSNGATVRVAVHVTIRVVLSGIAPPFRWSEPRSSSTYTLSRTAGGVGSDGTATAVFVGQRPGMATLQATATPDCQPQCGAASEPWQVQVVVQG